MATWRDFASIDMKKRAGANAVPIAVGYQNNGKAYSVPDPEAFTGSRRMNYGSGATIGNPHPTKMWMGMRTYDLSDEARLYKDEDLKSHGLYQDSDPYYHNILVGGANAGGKGFTALSALPFGILSKGRNRELFRNGQVKDVQAAIEKALSEGKHPRVAGHSWGASSVFPLALKYPQVPFILADPVSWTGVPDSIPKNVTILRPDNSTSEYKGRLAQILGHQWPKIEKGEGKTLTYRGGHTVGVSPTITRIVENERRRRDKELLRGLAESWNLIMPSRDYF